MNVTARLIQISNAIDEMERTAILPHPKLRGKGRSKGSPSYRDYVERTKGEGRTPLTKEHWERRTQRQRGHHLMDDEETEP